MDLQDYVNILHAAERDHDVNRYRYDGVTLWPLVRAQTISMFRSPNEYGAAKKNPTGSPGWKDALLFRYYRWRFLREFKAGPLKALEGKKCDILFYCKPSEHKDQVNGKWYDRFLDPFIEQVQQNYSFLKFQLYFPPESGQAPHRQFPAFFFDDGLYKARYFYKRKVEPLTAGDYFNAFKKLTGLDLNKAKFDSALNDILYFRGLFLLVLEKLKPRCVFFQGYYENDTFGLIAAAKQLGIKTVDIQHGKQGIYHPLYTHWTRIPDNGYELLPDFFWNWGEESFNNIEKWLNRKNLHVPVIGGNPWVGKWKFGSPYTPVSDEEGGFFDKLKTFDKVVLYTLQPLEEGAMLPEQVRSAIRNSPRGWLWMLRLHPFQKVTPQRILELIGETACAVETQFASSVPLYHLLKVTDHHVTLWSSTCFEANEFEVPTTIAHEFGRKLYDTYIKENVFSFTVSHEEMIRLIAEGKPNKKASYILTDHAVMHSAFRQIGLHIS